jgi:chromosome segregation ATPase
MKQVIRLAALGLGVVGLAACLAGVIAIWVVRPSVLRSSGEVLDAADGGLKVVEDKAARAAELIERVRRIMEPITSRIREVSKRAERTPEEEKEFRRMEEKLMDRLGEVDAIAQSVETAATILSQTTRRVESLRARSSDMQGLSEKADTLAPLIKKLGNLREKLAKLRDDKGGRKDIAKTVADITREATDDLEALDSAIERVRQGTGEWQKELGELRATVPYWTNWAVVLGSVFLAWMGLGQFALAHWGWRRICTRSSPGLPT